MSTQQKFLSEEGVKYLWSQISMKDYPNNEILVSVINAIDETKADRTELPEKPLTGTTLEITPNQILIAMLTGRQISLTHIDNNYGAYTFNYFVYNDALDAIIASLNIKTEESFATCTQLIGALSTNAWSFNANNLLLTNSVDVSLTKNGAPADAKATGNAIAQKTQVQMITWEDDD